MIKHLAVLTLEHLLSGISEENQNIFINIRKVEEISYENEQTTKSEYGSESEDGIFYTNKNDGGSSEITGKDSAFNESAISEENKVVGKAKTTRTINVKELTYTGKSFVNTMLDIAQTENLKELSLNEKENYLDYLNPSINFFKLLDIKGYVHYNRESFLYGKDENNLVSYPNHQLDDMDWCLDENGDIVPTMSSDDYNRTWQRIMNASNVQGMQESIVNRKLTKEDKLMTDIKCAYKNGKLYSLYGQTATYDDKVLAQMIGAEWNLPIPGFLKAVEQSPVLDTFAKKDWLCQPLGSKSTTTGSNKPSKGGKFDKLNKRNKAKQAQNDRANALNPNNDENANN